MIIIQVRGQSSFEMSFIKDDDMIRKFSTQTTNYTLNIGVLPRRSWRGDNLIDAIAVSEQILRDRIERKASTIRWAVHSAVGLSVTLKWTILRRLCARTTKTNNTLNVAVGTTKKLIATRSVKCGMVELPWQ